MSSQVLGRAGRGLSNVKIATKVMGGFGLVLALLVGTGAAGVLGLRSTSESLETYSRVSNSALAVAEVESDVTQLRRHVFIFAQTGGSAAANAARELLKEIAGDIPVVSAMILDPGRRERFAGVAKPIAEYGNHFESVVKLRTERDRLLRETLNPAGERIVGLFEQIVDTAKRAGAVDEAIALGGIEDEVTRARIMTLRFLDQPSAEAAAAIANQFAAIDKEYAAARGKVGAARAPLLMEINQTIGAYRTAVTALTRDVLEIERLVGTVMAALAMTAADTLNALNQAQTTRLNEVEAEARGEASNSLSLALGLSVGALLIGVALAWLIGRGISRPVTGMTEAMGRLARGDLSIEVPARGRGDEIGQMASAVQVFKENMAETERLKAEQEAMKAQAEAEKRASMQKLADEFEASIRGVVDTVSSAATELQATASTMSATAEETSAQATAVAAASEQASNNVQTVATAGEELSSSIAEIGRQVSESSVITRRAVEQASRTNAQIETLRDAAGKIGDVVKLINDIAAQTNLLALNATIEAARAGEAGKGFAVVASEVKTLANQTAKATEEISGKIAEMQQASQDSAQAIQTIGETIGQINEIASTIAAAIEEQGAATQEIASNVQQAARGTQDVSSNIVNVTQAAGETGAASQQVLASAGELARQGGMLREKVDTFVAKVRAA